MGSIVFILHAREARPVLDDVGHRRRVQSVLRHHSARTDGSKDRTCLKDVTDLDAGLIKPLKKRGHGARIRIRSPRDAYLAANSFLIRFAAALVIDHPGVAEL